MSAITYRRAAAETMRRYLTGEHHPQHARARRAVFVAGHLTARFGCDGELQWLLVAPANTLARRFYARHGAVELSEYWMVWPDISRAAAARGAGACDPAV